MSSLIFVAQLPPPLHGASRCNFISRGVLLKNGVKVIDIDFNFSSTLSDLRKLSFKKFSYSISVFFKIILSCFSRSKFVYFSMSPTGLALLRDIFYILTFKFFGKKVIIHLHGKGLRNASSGVSHLVKLAFQRSYVISLSKALKNDVSHLVEDGRHFECMNGAMDCWLGREVDSAPLKILFFSNLRVSKGIDYYLEICKSLFDNGCFFSAYIAGPFTSDFSINDLNAFYDVNPGLKDRIIYLGELDDVSKSSVLSSVDVLVHPSRNDAFPLVILEALSAACLVIASDQGGIPDILTHHDHGKVLSMSCIDDWVDAIVDISNCKDLKSRQISARNYYLNNFTEGHYELRFSKIFKEVSFFK